jgi:hypothetical protein
MLMRSQHCSTTTIALTLASTFALPHHAHADTPKSCATTQNCPLIVPKDPARCLEIERQIKRPADFVAGGQIQLDRIEKLVGEWMGDYCYRRASNGQYEWTHDATARDTGPFISTFANGAFSGKSFGTHAVARVWYSDEMHDWMLVNRPAIEANAPKNPPTIPDGAIMVKEMWPPPAELYRGECFDCKPPGSSGAVIFIRDSQSFSTGWFTGWWGNGAVIDWPAGPANSLTSMGDGGQGFCLNCHGSTTPGNTFASINNIAGHPATFETQLPPMSTQAPATTDHHQSRAIPLTKLVPIDQPLTAPDPDFLETYTEGVGASPLANAPGSGSASAPGSAPAPALPPPTNMPSQTYDSVLIPGVGPVNHFMTSTQCVGCHQANGTGLQLDMLDFTPGPLGFDPKEPRVALGPHQEPRVALGQQSQAKPQAQNPSQATTNQNKPISISPYSLWSSSPMGLAGRDPIFYAQLESEQIIHADWTDQTPEQKTAMRVLIQDTCLQCHGNMGQRQHAIDSHAETGQCAPFTRADANITPYPYTDESWPHQAQAASYAALARDGISCATCHYLALNEEAEKYDDAPWNICIKQKQKSLNPSFTGLAATFTGSFPLGSPDTINGPFEKPLTKPMENSLRVIPVHDSAISSSEVCASCHTIHLPVLDRQQPEELCLPQTDPPDPFRCFPKRYEQTTYPEWAFSAYRSGTLGNQKLPEGPGATPKTCQQCHMPSTDSNGQPLQSKIASIEEYSNYPQTDYRLPASEIDLPVRSPYAQHQLVGLNIFLIEMAQQFPDVLGIRTVDPGPGTMTVPALQVTENAMLHQARTQTARLTVDPQWDERTKTLRAQVSVENLAGHKFPSGVSFRRAFITFEVKDAEGKVLWASGRSNDAGLIIDQHNQPIPGEFWWQPDCSERLPSQWQPHYQQITAQNQAQIYQELITNAQGQLTTSFLSINSHPKDNRLQPHGFLPESARFRIAEALGDGTPLHGEGFPMDQNMAAAVAPEGEAALDPDYQNGSGMDRLEYVVSGLSREPASVEATLSYQSIPPFYQQDRYCAAANADGTPVEDTERLRWLAAHLRLDGTGGEGWRVVVGASRPADNLITNR